MAIADTMRLVLAPAASGRQALHHRRRGRRPCSAACCWAAGCSGRRALFTAFCLYFFRDPERVPPDAAGPGRGAGRWPGGARSGRRVPPAELGLGDAPRWRVAIFLSVLDVHVNRVPVDGTRHAHRLSPRRLPQRQPRQGERGERAQRPGDAAAGRARHRGGADRRADRAAHPLHVREGDVLRRASASASSASAAAPTSTCRDGVRPLVRGGPDHDRRRDGDRGARPVVAAR